MCGELFKDGVSQVRACHGGFITASINTQFTGVSSASSLLSDHYVDMQFYDDTNQSYDDYSGYSFLPGYSYPTDWLFYPPNLFTYRYPNSIRLGSTYVQSPIPSKLRLLDFKPRAPDGNGPLIVITDGDVLDTGGNAILHHQCGAYRNLAYEVVDQNEDPFNHPYSLTESFTDYQGPDSAPASFTLTISSNTVGDTQYFGRTAPACPGVRRSRVLQTTLCCEVQQHELYFEYDCFHKPRTLLRNEQGRCSDYYTLAFNVES